MCIRDRIAVVVLSVLFFRPFCKWICPLGAFYALMNKVSLLGIQVDTSKCVSCGKCARTCQMDVDITKSPNDTECIRCGKCIRAYQQLMQKENDILAANSDLWNKVFLSANKNSTMIEDGTNYGDFLLATIESAKDSFSADELKTLKAGAEQIKEIEGKLTILEQKYPGCGTAPGAGDRCV